MNKLNNGDLLKGVKKVFIIHENFFNFTFVTLTTEYNGNG